jgi:DNA-nicking Smr family endonuclease
MGTRDRDDKDDAVLWERVAKTAKPLKKSRIARVAARPKPAPPPKVKPGAKATRSEPEAAPRPIHTPKTSGLDRQTARKLGTGRLAVKARLDLHGMRQRDALTALRKFLKWAVAKDYRHVLVITGKGSPRAEPESFYEEQARGVLRQAVPHWLAQSDLAPLIVSVSEAPRRLGGEGALYVRLRKPEHARRKLKE